jgi:hypothetical protein
MAKNPRRLPFVYFVCIEDYAHDLSERRVEDDIIAALDLAVSVAQWPTSRRVWLEWIKDEADNREVIGEVLR